MGYCCWQLERGENGTPHFQGYVQFNDKMSLSKMKALGGLERAHLEVAKGKWQDNKKYCSKDEGRLDGPFEVSALMD